MITLLLGLMVGVIFGLTGNGGSTLAMPLLVYGLHLRPHAAVCVSMIAIGTLAVVRVVQSARAGGVDNRLGWQLAFGGIVGAPLGALTGRHLSEHWLMFLFAALLMIVAVRLWTHQTIPASPKTTGSRLENMEAKSHTRRFWLFAALGFGSGVLSGLFGVGGGFILIPGLMLIGGLEIHRALATAMLTIALVGASAMAAHFSAGQRVPFETTILFTLGGLMGLWPGIWLAARIPGVWLKRAMAVAIFSLGVFILVHSLIKI